MSLVKAVAAFLKTAYAQYAFDSLVLIYYRIFKYSIDSTVFCITLLSIVLCLLALSLLFFENHQDAMT